MIINIYFYILIAFILPWIISIHYLKRKPSLFITNVPIVSSIAMLMNIIGFMINSIDSKKYSTLTFLVFYSLLTTIMEYGAFSVGIVDYGNGWNIGWSLVSYLVAYTIVIIYRKLISTFV
ncbi:hypothetical protein BK146_00020 [Paenibacillus sp. FSL R7-0333]|nr:hypothetical protein BK146_00020 [Paenibacillus sp. FSL R7-0333]